MNACVTRTVTKIEANPLLVKGKSDFRIMRVAAYCRVSTDDEDQLNSYQAQIAYYTDAIAKRPNSTFAGIYADEGITGLSTKKRKDFMRLIRILREQLHLAKEQTQNNAGIQAEIERFMITIQEYSVDSFTDYDDTIVRRLVECIKVMPDRTIEVILKGGIHGKEKVC